MSKADKVVEWVTAGKGLHKRPRKNPPRPGPNAMHGDGMGGFMGSERVHTKVRNRAVEGHTRKAPVQYQHDPRPLSEIYQANGDMTDIRKARAERVKRRETQRAKDTKR